MKKKKPIYSTTKSHEENVKKKPKKRKENETPKISPEDAINSTPFTC